MEEAHIALAGDPVPSAMAIVTATLTAKETSGASSEMETTLVHHNAKDTCRMAMIIATAQEKKSLEKYTGTQCASTPHLAIPEKTNQLQLHSLNPRARD